MLGPSEYTMNSERQWSPDILARTSILIKAEHCPELVEMKQSQQELLDQIRDLHRKVCAYVLFDTACSHLVITGNP